MKALRMVGKVALLLLVGLVASNVLLPAVARAQFASAGGASVGDVLGALVGQNVSATKYLSTAASGEDGFSCASVGCRLRLAPSGTAGNAVWYWDLSRGMQTDAGLAVGPGQNVMADNLTPRTMGEPIHANGAQGFHPVLQSAVGTCGTTAAPEGVYVQLAATSTSVTRWCHCIKLTTSGASRWENDSTHARGTTTDDCPETAS
jgi:hypothetical protein